MVYRAWKDDPDWWQELFTFEEGHKPPQMAFRISKTDETEIERFDTGGGSWELSSREEYDYWWQKVPPLSRSMGNHFTNSGSGYGYKGPTGPQGATGVQGPTGAMSNFGNAASVATTTLQDLTDAMGRIAWDQVPAQKVFKVNDLLKKVLASKPGRLTELADLLADIEIEQAHKKAYGQFGPAPMNKKGLPIW